MAKQYRFRLIHLVCENNKVFEKLLTQTIYRDRPYAVEVCNTSNRRAISEANMQYNKGKPIPVHTVHGFYLVHESLFDEILKNHSK